MLTGFELINTITENSTDDEKVIARKCGYASVTKDGKEKINLTSFFEAILIAKGL